MKKIMAFLMVFAICFVCLGTYGFEQAACTDNHDHSAHAILASEFEEDDGFVPSYVYMEVSKAVYNELASTIQIEIDIMCDSFDDIKSGVLTIQASNKLLGKPEIIGGYIYGNKASSCASVTKSTGNITEVTIQFTQGTGSDAFITLEYPVDTRYFQYLSRETYLSFGGSVTTVADDVIGYDPLSRNASVYVCSHKETETRVSVKPTCLATGEQETICSVCKYVISTRPLLTVDHTYDYSKPLSVQINPYQAPTCTTQGFGSFECLVCKKINTATIPRTGHKLGERFLRNGHYWQVCTVCNVEVYAENQCTHDPENYTAVKMVTASTCTTAGSAIYKCPECNQEETRTLELKPHAVSTWSTIKAATCTATGTKAGTCAVCTKSVVEEIPTLEHTFGDWKITKAPTCTEAGVKTRTCTICNSKSEYEQLEAIGHSYGTWVTTKNATCVEAGIKKCICTTCGSERTDILPLTGHNYGPYTTTKEPTCKDKGIQTRNCLTCSVADSKEIPAVPTNHVFGDAVVVTAKTCLTDGLKERTCVHCSEKMTETDAATGHTLGAPVVDGKLATRACVCGYQEVAKTVKNGVEKTLTCHAGALEIVGAVASADYAFELNVMPMADAANYKQYYTTFTHAYVFKLLSAGENVTFTSDMTLSINLDSSFDGYAAKVVVLRNGAFYPVNNTETDDGVVTVNGQDLIGAEAIFLEKGEEMKPSFVLPLIITIAVIVVAAVVIVIILSKKNKRD
jgi:hypothetical protein